MQDYLKRLPYPLVQHVPQNYAYFIVKISFLLLYKITINHTISSEL